MLLLPHPSVCVFIPAELQGVKVLSYPQYCRFRSLQRRIQDGARGPSLEDPHLLALGGVKVLPHTRLMYCRDTFNHPALESSACFSWQFSQCLLFLEHQNNDDVGYICVIPWSE